jgi:tetratricopeptide (TPR) repeat protein
MLAKKERLSDTEKKFHRKIAAECFNRTWDYLKQENRSPDEDQMMLNLAHASRYHWSVIGKPSNFAIGDWQISRVYSALNQKEMAVHFAKTSLETCRKNDLSGWLLASAYEGMARAYVANRNYQFAREYLDKARQQLRSQVVDEEDLKTISDQIDETERMIPK